MRNQLLLFSLVILMGCGGGGGLPAVQTDLGKEVPGKDALEEVAPDALEGFEEAREELLSDAVTPDEGREQGPDILEEAIEDVGPQCPGGFGCPCEQNEDCLSLLCMESAEGKTCTKACSGAESCPPGWTCELVSGGGSDVTYACVDRFSDLCRPCKKDEDCQQMPGSKANKCLFLGADGSFCGVECSESLSCPEGYECADSPVRGGAKQCKPVGGVCPCTDKFKKNGYKTECYVQNAEGKCTGERTCDQPCNAPVPTKEECNSKDDNCNGVTDEGLSGLPCTPPPNQWGACPGTQLCIGGQLFCQSLKEAGPEVCNGIDDDCDGSTDEDFTDQDGDKVADCVDPDVDGDGVVNNEDNCPNVANEDQKNTDGDSLGDVCDDNDDNDAILDSEDNCPLVKNSDQKDTDNDGIGDACDCDIDGDGVPNKGPDCPPPVPEDNCPYTPNPSQKDSNKNGIGDACEGDKDQDGVPDALDNCPDVPNPDQKDLDKDKMGDACDPDDDGDGVNDDKDKCPEVFDPDQADFDKDGMGDACDPDDDNDGWSDGADCVPKDPAVHPQAPEICDGVDNDCSGVADEGCTYEGADITPVTMALTGKPDFVNYLVETCFGGGPLGTSQDANYVLELGLFPSVVSK